MLNLNSILFDASIFEDSAKEQAILENIFKVRETYLKAETQEDKEEARGILFGAVLSFNELSFDHAMKTASYKKACFPLLPKTPKKEEDKKPGYTYRGEQENPVFYHVFNSEFELTTKRVTLTNYAMKSIMPSNVYDSMVVILKGFDTGIQKYIEKSTFEGCDEIKKAFDSLIETCGLAGLLPYLNVNKSLIRAMVKPYAKPNNDGKIPSYFGELEKASKAYAKSTELDRIKTRNKYEQVTNKCVKLVFGILEKAIALKARNVSNVSMLTYEQIEEKANE